MRISDWSSDVCSSDLPHPWLRSYPPGLDWSEPVQREPLFLALDRAVAEYSALPCLDFLGRIYSYAEVGGLVTRTAKGLQDIGVVQGTRVALFLPNTPYYVICYFARSEEHTSELQSLMRISYAVFCLKKKTKINTQTTDTTVQQTI